MDNRDRVGTFRWALLVSVISSSAIAAAEPQSYGFVISNIYIASYADDSVCPRLSKSANELFLESLPEPLRTRLADPEHGEEFRTLMHERSGFKLGLTGRPPGKNLATPHFSEEEIAALRDKYGIPEGKGRISYLGARINYDLCTDPEDFPLYAEGNQPYMGKVAYGINLDGKIKDSDFLSPDGEPGVDNALISAIGCDRTTRDYGNPAVANQVITSVPSPTLMVVSGVDDVMNDEEVLLHFYASTDPIEVDGRGRPLAMATYDIDPETRYHASARASIRDGRLTSEPFDLNVRVREQIIDSFTEVRGARVQFNLDPEGAVEGNIYGYHTLESFQDSLALAGTIGTNLLSCPSTVKAIREKADGYPDPETGDYTAISSALKFYGVRAFAAGAPKSTVR